MLHCCAVRKDTDTSQKFYLDRKHLYTLCWCEQLCPSILVILAPLICESILFISSCLYHTHCHHAKLYHSPADEEHGKQLL